jgi:uncharacterized protein YceK
MQKAVALTLAAVAALMFSGCAVVGKYTGPVEGGKKTTVGLIAFDSVDNGYPMLPFYSSFEQGK